MTGASSPNRNEGTNVGYEPQPEEGISSYSCKAKRSGTNVIEVGAGKTSVRSIRRISNVDGNVRSGALSIEVLVD